MSILSIPFLDYLALKRVCRGLICLTTLDMSTTEILEEQKQKKADTYDFTIFFLKSSANFRRDTSHRVIVGCLSYVAFLNTLD